MFGMSHMCTEAENLGDKGRRSARHLAGRELERDVVRRLANNGADRRYALVCPDGERLVEPSDLLFVLIHSRDKYDELSAYRGPDPTSPMTPVPSGDPNPGGSS